MKIKLFLLFISVTIINANVLQIKKNVAAKVLDVIITKNNVQKHADKYNLTYEQSLNELVDFEVLYLAAKIEGITITAEDVSNQIETDMRYYASHFRKDLDSISKQEFLQAAGIGNRTMNDYKNYTERSLIVSHYLNMLYESIIDSPYLFTDEEINSFIANNPENFIIPESYEVMMIYFSYFDDIGNMLPDHLIKEKVRRSAECLDLLKKDAPFSTVALQYSDDKESLRGNPPGYVGKIEKNDPFMIDRFSNVIMDAFSTSKETGLINKVYGTENGLYIFKLVSKTKEIKMIGSELYSKAQNDLYGIVIEQKRSDIKAIKTEMYKKRFSVEIYK